MKTLALTLGTLALTSITAHGADFELKDGTTFTVRSGEWTHAKDVLVGKSNTTPGAWLLSDKSYADFDLSLEFKADRGVGAVVIRAHELPATPIPAEPAGANLPQRAYGYGIAAGGPRTGSLLDLENKFHHFVDDESQKAYRGGKWQNLEVSARGNSFRVELNGKTVLEASEDYYTTGKIGFFFQGPVDDPAEFRIRNIKLTDLGRTGDWKPLFNGENLDGWVKWGTESWTVKDGIIEGTSGPDKSEGYLATEKQWGDFHVRGTFKILGEGNYGLFYHSTIAYNDKNYPIISGVQTEVAPGTPSPSGWLYESYKRGWLEEPDMTNPAAYALNEGEWNEIEVLSKGNHIISWVNGIKVADFTDPTPNYDKGAFALQLHTGGVDGILWKDLYVKEAE